MQIFSPLEHFEINYFTFYNNLFYDFSITSIALFLLSTIIFLYFFFFCALYSNIIPTRSQYFAESFFILLMNIFKQQISSIRADRFFPIVFSLFLYIFVLNFSSLFVYGVSLTGHIMVTAFFSFSIFISLIIVGFLSYGSSFFRLFVPKGVPNILLDFIIIIEIFSFAIRPFSLAIRLFANMLAGHTLMGIFSKFLVYIINNYFILFFVPLLFVFLVLLLEIAVSLIQAYIFVSLVCIYLNDVLNLHG